MMLTEFSVRIRRAGFRNGAPRDYKVRSMSATERTDLEPAPLAELAPFEEGDFHALSEGLSRDPQYNDRRLATRRKLAAIAQSAVKSLVDDARASGGELELLARTSLHQPHQFNHMKVRRLWAYVCRGKKEKSRLKRTLGAELAKDLDAAYRNAYLCVAVESDALEVSLRIHPDAWFDGQNLVNRVKKEGRAIALALLNQARGYRLRLDNWKGEWICGELTGDRLTEFFKYYKPGELGLAIERRWPAPHGARGAALDAQVPEQLVTELRSLGPLYRFVAWSQESEFLFAK
jgi:hypothetical protein